MEEEYKSIKGFSTYLVSNFGNVKTNQDVQLEKKSGTNKYYYVELNDGNQDIKKTIHRQFF